jgi:hypothetical protein
VTAISEFYDPVRFILGDHDPACPDVEDAAIARGIKFIVRSGEVPSYAVAGDSITPDVAAARDYRLITLLTARAFRASEPDSKAMRVRQHAWSKGGYKTFLTMLDLAIAETRNGGSTGSKFCGWSNFLSWLEAQSGVHNIWMQLTRLKLETPLAQVTVSTGGTILGQAS